MDHKKKYESLSRDRTCLTVFPLPLTGWDTAKGQSKPTATG